MDPPAVNPFTAAFSVATEVISWVSAVAVSEKLTTPMWLPEPMFPSLAPSVASSMISMKVSAPGFHVGQRAARHTPRPIQHQHDIGGVRRNIRGGRQGQGHSQRPVTADLIHVYLFV